MTARSYHGVWRSVKTNTTRKRFRLFFVRFICVVGLLLWFGEQSIAYSFHSTTNVTQRIYLYLEISLLFGLDFDSKMNQEDADNSHGCAEAVERSKTNESSPKLLNENFFRSYHLVHCLSSFLDVWIGNGVHSSYLICSTSQYVTSKYIMLFCSRQTGNRYHLRCFILVCWFSVYLIVGGFESKTTGAPNQVFSEEFVHIDACHLGFPRTYNRERKRQNFGIAMKSVHPFSLLAVWFP